MGNHGWSHGATMGSLEAAKKAENVHRAFSHTGVNSRKRLPVTLQQQTIRSNMEDHPRDSSARTINPATSRSVNESTVNLLLHADASDDRRAGTKATWLTWRCLQNIWLRKDDSKLQES